MADDSLEDDLHNKESATFKVTDWLSLIDTKGCDDSTKYFEHTWDLFEKALVNETLPSHAHALIYMHDSSQTDECNMD